MSGYVFINVGDEYNGYRDVVTGEHTDSQTTVAWKQADILTACANGGEYVGEFEDPRLVTTYVGTAEDRDNDRESAYVSDVLTSKSGVVPEDKQYAGHYGYDVVPAADHVVRCWYCNGQFSYREFDGPVANEAGMQAFVVAMLQHYYECKAEFQVPYVTTYFPGRSITTPGGKVYTKPGVVRTWRINGKLLAV